MAEIEKRRNVKMPVNAPAWFSLERYGVLQALTISQWADLLSEQKLLSRIRLSPANLDAWTLSRPFGTSSFLDGPIRFDATFSGCFLNAHLPNPQTARAAIHEVLHGTVINEFDVMTGDAAALIVDLKSPSGILIDAFVKWLKQKRETFPDAVQKPGRPSIENLRFDDSSPSSWIRYKIVELSDLEFWFRHHSPGRSLTAADYGDLLYDSDGEFDGDSAERIREARAVRKKAYQVLPSLQAQVSAEMH